jgi:protein MpaA
MRRRVLVAAAIAAACALGLIAAGSFLPGASGGIASDETSGGAPISAKQALPSKQATEDFLAFTKTPRRPGNLLERVGVVGHSAEGRPIGLRQLGDPRIDGRVLIVGCIHGDECAGSKIVPTSGGCPDPLSNVFVVPNLNPDGTAIGTRLNGRGVDLNRNFPSQWRSIGHRGDAQYSGPRALSEPESRLAARLIRGLAPDVTIWLHQHRAARPLVRAWGPSTAAGRRLAELARIPFRLLPWPDGTAPNWQNHRFPGTSSFVVELPPGALAPGLHSRLNDAIIRIARQQARVGED